MISRDLNLRWVSDGYAILHKAPDFSNCAEIWQAPRQQRCRDACQISERYNHHNIQSSGFEASQDLTVRPQIAKFMRPTWGPPGSCRPQMGPMLAPWTLLSGTSYGSVNRGLGLDQPITYTACRWIDVAFWSTILIFAQRRTFYTHIAARGDFPQNQLEAMPPQWHSYGHQAKTVKQIICCQRPWFGDQYKSETFNGMQSV